LGYIITLTATLSHQERGRLEKFLALFWAFMSKRYRKMAKKANGKIRDVINLCDFF